MSAIVAAVSLTAGLVAEATGAVLATGNPAVVFSAVSTDTRSLAPGALFIALRGDRFDGHDFVPLALERGAAGVLVSTPPADSGTAAVLVVPDTLAGLQALGHDVRRRSGARVVAITGSAGKTSTKEMSATLLAVRYDVFRNEGNFNNHIGLPLSLLELRRGPEVAVVELGMSHAGEIRRLTALADPDVRVWINVGDAHIGQFGSRDAVAAAKAEILEGARPGALLIANADDDLVMSHVAGFAGRVLRFGRAEGADVRATDVEDFGIDGARATIDTPRGDISVRLALPAAVHLSNVLAAVAIAVAFDVPALDIEAGVAGFKPVQRRGQVIALRHDARLVDDSYNASPAAVRAMLEAIGQTAVAGRRLAVLGEMRELGTQAQLLHEACGRAAAAAAIEELVVVGGPVTDALADGAADAGLPRMQIHRFATSEAAAEAVPGLVGPGDVILVKGSRATRTDIVADRLVRDLGAA